MIWDKAWGRCKLIGQILSKKYTWAHPFYLFYLKDTHIIATKNPKPRTPTNMKIGVQTASFSSSIWVYSDDIIDFS